MKTFIFKKEGIVYKKKIQTHINTLLLTDTKVIEFLKNGIFSIEDFNKLPDNFNSLQSEDKPIKKKPIKKKPIKKKPIKKMK